MMLDGKWTSNAHSSSAWTEPSSYGTNTTSGNAQNHGRTDAGAATNGRGICPPNWHVPTDNEWGIILDAMESSRGSTAHQNASGAGWYGDDAGLNGKSKCVVADNLTYGNTYVDDEKANWYYWAPGLGRDLFGFRALPSGFRLDNGAVYSNRGSIAMFWTSSAYDDVKAWYRRLQYSEKNAGRYPHDRMIGLTIRCFRD
jgi:uncharacterized protein (TIGR02145 family)